MLDSVKKFAVQRACVTKEDASSEVCPAGTHHPCLEAYCRRLGIRYAEAFKDYNLSVLRDRAFSDLHLWMCNCQRTLH